MLYSVHCSLQGALNSAKGGVGCLCVDLAAASTLTAARGGGRVLQYDAGRQRLLVDNGTNA